MISTQERERAEKSRSAFAASQTNQKLRMSETTISRYLSPPRNTTHPLEYAFHLLGDVRGQTILEYGCGDGMNTVVLSRRGASVIGLDLSPELLALAKERLRVNQCHESSFVLGSAHELPFEDESVDIVFGIAILHHLDLGLAASEVQRVLKKGGRAIFQEPLRNSKLVAHVRGLFPNRADVSPFERPLTDKELKDFASPCQYQAKTFQLMLSRMATFIPFFQTPISKTCEHVDATLLRLFPPLSYYGSVKVFEMAKY
jgi:ubiquinone/menaquinone biosynthesis C-methylase UbiE